MKYVLLTGAFGGMGRATTIKLLENGFYVFALDKRIDTSLAEQFKDTLCPIEADVTDMLSLANAFDKVKAVTNELFAIVHFAGIYDLNSLVEIPEEKFVKIFDINLFGAYRTNKIFLPLLKKGSRILITTSELAPLDPLPFTGIYAITKSALDKYAYSLRMEVQLLGISVSVLRPGAIKTDMLGVSTTALDRFCENTSLYTCNAKRFKNIVNSVEAKNISTEKLANKACAILLKRKVKHVYKINRNKLLLLLNILPKKLQTAIIKKILKPKKDKQ